jgi:hypothetical protein
VNQSVDDSAVGVKLRNERIEKPAIRVLVLAPRRPADEVCHLDQSGGPRIDKERHLRQVPEMSPPATDIPETPRESLKRLLVGTLVHDDETALVLASPIQRAAQEKIEAVAHFLERDLHRVGWGGGELVHGDSEELCAHARNQAKCPVDQLFPLWSASDRSPHAIAAGIHRASVQFDVLAWAEIEAFDAIVRRLDRVVEPALEKRDAAQNEETLPGIADVAGIVNVQDMHLPNENADEWNPRIPADRNAALSTADG